MNSLSIRTLLLLTISALTLLIGALVIRETYLQWHQLSRIKELKGASLLGDQLFNAAEKLSVERDISLSLLHVPDENVRQDLIPHLAEARKAVDQALSSSYAALAGYNFKKLKMMTADSEKQIQALQSLRHQIDQSLALPVGILKDDLSRRTFNVITSMIMETRNLWIELTTHFTDIDPIVTMHLRFKHLLRVVMDYSGRQRSLIGQLIIENADPSPQQQANLLLWQGTLALAWSNGTTLAQQSNLSALLPYLKDAQSHYLNVHDMVKDLFFIPGNKHGASYPISADLWLEIATQATDSLYALRNKTLEHTQLYVDTLEQHAEKAILLYGALLLFTLTLCACSFSIVMHRVISPINSMAEALLNAIQGRPVSFDASYAERKDEIGKLSQALHVFQQKAEQIKLTSLALERYTHALERSNKELDDFAYIASHDLKEPLRGIHNHARFLLEDYEKHLPEDGTRRLNRLVYLSQRMETLVNDLLYFSRIGRQELAVQPTDMNAVIKDIQSTLDAFFEEHHARIQISGVLPTLSCDSLRVTEAFRNLITNAIKYNDKDIKLVEIGFVETCKTTDGRLEKQVFYVRDNGKGIAHEFHTDIFRIFKRLESGKSADDGSGVGLTFVKKIIERHGGSIWLESQIGKGTTFYFTLGEIYHEQKRAA